MNVIVSNKNQGLLSSLDVDIIKSINGEFTVDEIIGTFSNFFFNRMFLDITAIKDYMNISNIQKLSMSMEMDKVIILMDNELMSNNNYLSKLISMGIYNFASNKENLMYLYNHPNTYKDVAHIHQLTNNDTPTKDTPNKTNSFFGSSNKEEHPINSNIKIVGFRNVTTNAGATTLIYMLKKALSADNYIVALEVNKNDFGFFNEKDMYSVNQNNLKAAINKFGTSSMILIDLNNLTDDSICDEIIYLMEPSTIKLNKMMMTHKDIFDKLYGKKIVLNKSMLTEKDVKDFEFESHSQIACNIPPLNDREDNRENLKELIELLKQ